jgi:hypothetical protein
MMMSMSDGIEYVCAPCDVTIEERNPRVTVHDSPDPDVLTVWCPWCGDAMERALKSDGENV